MEEEQLKNEEEDGDDNGEDDRISGYIYTASVRKDDG